jgi:uncharacterized OB-fold protein
VPDELDKPFWDACNEGRLIIQDCRACARLQHPPRAACSECGSSDALGWREVSGRGTIHSYGVVYDTPVTTLQADQPFNLAVVQLDEDPGINIYSHLPGTPLDEVPIGGRVQVVFESTIGGGQKIPEWQLVP